VSKMEPELEPWWCLIKKKCGRKLKDYKHQLANMSNIPFSDRTCFRSTSAATEIPMTRLHSIVKNGVVCRDSSAAKSVLMDANKQLCIQNALNNINMDRRLFDLLMYVVYVDEKWFNMKQENMTNFLAEEEVEPHRTAKSKCYIKRPRFDTTRNSHFDGMLGIVPVTTMVPAQCSSQNLHASTMVMKPMAVTKEVYCDFICNIIIPAIQEKCHCATDLLPSRSNKTMPSLTWFVMMIHSCMLLLLPLK
jgi:hypothetical protein